jgi:integrase
MNLNRLSARKVQTAGIGWHNDGGGLYLQVTKTGRSWVFRYTPQGHDRDRYMGLGAVVNVGLAKAREKAAAARKLKVDGVDPIEHRKAQRGAIRLAASTAMTFHQCATNYVDAHRAGWRNAKHAEQWTTSLRDYVDPHIGALPVAAIDTGLVLKCLRPIWETKTETASRIRGRIEAVLSYAKVCEYRTGENPARWRGHLDQLLPKPAKVAKKRHHAALPFDQLPAFIAELRARNDRNARALEFLILTATRLSEVANATWEEIKLDRREWVIPGTRMKGGKDHVVPLSRRCLEILRQHSQTGRAPFPSNQMIARVLKLMGRNDITVHGFRSTFRDWAAERTQYPNHVVEMALAHSIPSAVEAAYRRGNLLEKRRRLMDAWAEFCASPAKTGETVVFMRPGA